MADIIRKNIADQEKANGPKVTDTPLVVLVNEGTASAAELLASALPSNRRAKLVGASTFGKGMVHSLERLRDGSSIVITVGLLRALEGRNILGNGILPDVRIKQPPAAFQTNAFSSHHLQFQRAVTLLMP